jgi:hypothetical protein
MTTPVPPTIEGLPFALVVNFRAHGHLCNVLTHIGSGNWRAIEEAVSSVLRPRVKPKHLNPIARNIVELIADGRGTTGPIMRSVFFGTIAGEAGAQQANRIKRKIAGLRRGMRSESSQSPTRAIEQPKASDVPEPKHPRATDTACGAPALSRAA